MWARFCFRLPISNIFPRRSLSFAKVFRPLRKLQLSHGLQVPQAIKFPWFSSSHSACKSTVRWTLDIPPNRTLSTGVTPSRS
ncbi:hypothetical protein HZ326_4941 [Fusarium oxysporum f. sp. albedinis]|nr:hypothetical protein HZ326_4941 [Fusarium oxysporum f. sp. albedinis]